MRTALHVQTLLRTGWLPFIGGVLGYLGTIFGKILMVDCSIPGMDLTLLWAAAVFCLIGMIAMIHQIFQQRSACSIPRG